MNKGNFKPLVGEELTCSPKTLPNEMVKISENNKGDKDEEKI